MNKSQNLLFFLFFLLSKFSVESYRQDDYLIQSSFLQGNKNVLDYSNELSEAVLAEFEDFNAKVLDKLSEKMVDLLYKDGFDLNDKNNVNKLYTFLQNANVDLDLNSLDVEEKQPPRTFGQKLLHGFKKAASGIGKEVLVHTTKAVVAYGVKQAMPEIEKMFKQALSGLPVNLRVAVSPLVFKMWKGLFERAGVPFPRDFNLKGIIFDGLNQQQRREAEAYLKGKM